MPFAAPATSILLADAVDAGLDERRVETESSGRRRRIGSVPAIEERPVITLPYPALASAAAGFGHNFIALDPDGPARRFAPFVRKGNRYMPSLGMAAALVAGGVPSRRSRPGRRHRSACAIAGSRSCRFEVPTCSDPRSVTISRRC